MTRTDVSWYITDRIDEQKVYAEVALEVQRGQSVMIHHHLMGKECNARCVRKP